MGAYIILFLQGMLIGGIISVPVGPVNIMCFNHSMQQNRIQGFKITLGATLADTIFAILAVLGVKTIVAYIENNRSAFEMISGAVLIVFSMILIVRMNAKASENKVLMRGKLKGGMLASFLITLSNPLTILVFIAYLSMLIRGLDSHPGLFIILFTSGVIFGSMSWFFSLSWLVTRFKERISGKLLYRINFICSIGLIVFGIAMIAKSVLL